MPNPKCAKCDRTETILWRKVAENEEICNKCYESDKVRTEQEQQQEKDSKEADIKEKEEVQKEALVLPEATKIRKSTRSTRFKNKAVTRQKSKSTSRRSASFKVNRPNKTPKICAETKTKTHVFHDGFYYQVGDIVSLKSKGKKYYAQIRSLIEDTFCEKSAVLTWLLPTTSSPDPNESFDPATYLIGLEEDLPRRIANTMEFVMHSSSTYFISKTEPYSKPEHLEDSLYSEKNKKGFLWTNVN